MGFPTSVTRASQAWAAANALWNVYRLLTKRPPEVELQKTPWRPPQWKSSPQVHIIDAAGVSYVFDAILKTDHTTALRSTEHPVQNGAAIVDHSFQLPERCILEIGMSDVMDSYDTGTWQEYSTKSISAYQKLKELQYKRIPMMVVTRLNTYENMIIENMHAPDDFRTVEGLRCSVTFKQIIAAQVKVVKVSARPQTSQQSKKGVKQPKPITPELGSALSEMGF